jgi:putative ABC transport system ATP-binding protein
MVTHDPRMAAYADRLLFLKDGLLVGEARPELQGATDADWVAAKMREMA